jgi:nucleoside 2-deoxyribosyltransferase
MAQRKKPRCFIAMAFDYSDTDSIYDQHIKPVLKRNNVTPIIINRQESNKDINNQIIEHLDDCDFCIADLTYTRPSVYFEAGYAQKMVEVIYTARTDHLGKNQPEDKRVHFDLQMKPIIKWKDPDDKTFANRLEKRLKKTVLKDWLKQTNESLKEKAEKDKFTAQSLGKQLEIYRKIGIKTAINHNFNDWVIKGFYGPYNRAFDLFDGKVYKNPSRYSKKDVYFIGEKKRDGILKMITIRATKKALVDLFRFYKARIDYGISDYILAKTDKDFKNIKEIEEHHLILSPTKTPASRIKSNIPSLHVDNVSNRYYLDSTFEFTGGKKKIVKNRKVFLYFPSQIDSESKIKEKITNILSEI